MRVRLVRAAAVLALAFGAAGPTPAAGAPEAFVLTQAGCVGLNGVNARSVAVCTNALWQLDGSRAGLPVAFVVRGLLRQRSADEAAAFLRRVRHASGQNYVIGGPD